MVRGYWVTLRNSSGALDQKFCRREEQIGVLIGQFVQELGEMFSAGDSITVEEGESEQD